MWPVAGAGDDAFDPLLPPGDNGDLLGVLGTSLSTQPGREQEAREINRERDDAMLHEESRRKRPRDADAETAAALDGVQDDGLGELKELRERFQVLQRQNALYKTILGAGREASSSSKSYEQLEAALNQPQPRKREKRVRRVVSDVWNSEESFGLANQSQLSCDFFDVARALVPFRSVQLLLSLLSTKSKQVMDAVARELQLDASQVHVLQQKRTSVLRLQEQYLSVFRNLAAIQDCHKRAKKVFGSLMTSVTDILRPSQMAKFMVWVQNDAACKDILDKLWQSTLTNLDNPHADFSSSQVGNVTESQQFLIERRTNSIYTLKHVLGNGQGVSGGGMNNNSSRSSSSSSSKDSNESSSASMAAAALTADVVLQDPTRSPAEVHGRDQVLHYFGQVSGSGAVDLVNFRVEGDSALATWSVAPRRVTMQLYFGPESNQICSIVMQWDGWNPWAEQAQAQEQEQTQDLGVEQEQDALQDHQHYPRPVQPPLPLPLPTQLQQQTQEQKQEQEHAQGYEDLVRKRIVVMESIPELFAVRKSTGRIKKTLRFEKLFDPNLFLVDQKLGGEFRGWDRCKQYMAKLAEAFPVFKVSNATIVTVSDLRFKCRFDVSGIYVAGSSTSERRNVNLRGTITGDFGGPSSVLVQQLYLEWEWTNSPP